MADRQASQEESLKSAPSSRPGAAFALDMLGQLHVPQLMDLCSKYIAV